MPLIINATRNLNWVLVSLATQRMNLSNGVNEINEKSHYQKQGLERER